eukprot:6925668-Karenia_brevis.AAC.1
MRGHCARKRATRRALFIWCLLAHVILCGGSQIFDKISTSKSGGEASDIIDNGQAKIRNVQQ